MSYERGGILDHRSLDSQKANGTGGIFMLS